MGSTLDIPVPATSQLIGTDCIPTAIIRRRHQNFIRTQKEWDFISEASYPDTMRLYCDCIPTTKKVSDCIPTVIMPGLYSDCNCPILNTVGILYQNLIVVETISNFKTILIPTWKGIRLALFEHKPFHYTRHKHCNTHECVAMMW